MKTKPRLCPTQHKAMYPSQKVALRVLLAASRKRGTALRVYRHHECGSWHITKKVKFGVDNDNQRSIA